MAHQPKLDVASAVRSSAPTATRRGAANTSPLCHLPRKALVGVDPRPLLLPRQRDGPSPSRCVMPSSPTRSSDQRPPDEQSSRQRRHQMRRIWRKGSRGSADLVGRIPRAVATCRRRLGWRLERRSGHQTIGPSDCWCRTKSVTRSPHDRMAVLGRRVASRARNRGCEKVALDVVVVHFSPGSQGGRCELGSCCTIEIGRRGRWGLGREPLLRSDES